MAERKAVNKYYPPDWDPSKGSVNKTRNSHPLRARARKLDQGILVVRFEMPFNVWCMKCDNHVAMGVRYNAEKSTIGHYYSTPIYRFKMKCHLCDNYFEIDTDPAKFDYIVNSGARKQVRATDVETSDLDSGRAYDEVEAKKRATDAMFRLEKKVEDQMKAQEHEPSLEELKLWRSKRQDSFAINQLVRKQYRDRRKKLEETRSKDRQLLKKFSLNMPLAKTSIKDRIEASNLLRQSMTPRLLKRESVMKKNLLNSSIKTL